MRHSQKCLFGLSPHDLDEIASEAKDDLAGLQNRSLFLSGGTGFFGKWILAALAYVQDLNLDVTVLSRNPAGFVEKFPETAAFHFVSGNVADYSTGAERYDFIIHAATETTAISTEEQEEERSRVILEGTRRMLALAQTSGARLLNISSGGVYGVATGKLSGAREEEEPAPVTAYGQAKLAAEKLCAESGADFITARAFAFLGPWLPLDAHYAAGNFLRDALAGGPILVRGDGTALRSYLYPTDLVRWLLALLVRGRKGAAYNVGSDEVVSTGELAHRTASDCSSAPAVTIQSTQPPGLQNIYLPDVNRARTELGLEVRVKLDDAIRRTLAFLRARAT